MDATARWVVSVAALGVDHTKKLLPRTVLDAWQANL
jgi:hypothetical protein